MSRSGRSLQTEASNAFMSPTQLTAKRMGQRPLTPRSLGPPSCGTSVGGQSRRSVSMIKTVDDEEVFSQIGGATAVSVGSKQSKRITQQGTRLPMMDFMEGKFSMEDIMQGTSMDDFVKGANAAAENLMRSLSPTSCTVGGGDDIQSQEGGFWNFVSTKPSMTSYGNQTASSAQRTPLDLHHNDNSFHVLANLLIDFLQTKLTPDGKYIVLQPEDSIRMERVLPEILRLDFIDAVVYRLKNTPSTAKSSLDLLTLQCHELGIDRDGRLNPILAAANLESNAAYVPVQSVLDEQVDEPTDMVEELEPNGDIPSDESSTGTLSKNPTSSIDHQPTLDEKKTPTYEEATAPDAQSEDHVEEAIDPDEIADVRLMASEEISLATTIPESSTIQPICSKISSGSQRTRSNSPSRQSPVPCQAIGSGITSKPPKSLEKIASFVLKEEDKPAVSISESKATSMFGFKIPSLGNETSLVHGNEGTGAARADENLSPMTTTGGFFSSMNPFVGFGFNGKCAPDSSTDVEELQRQKQQLSLTIQRTFSESVATSPMHAFKQGRELTLDETKALAKEQLYAEIREAQALISQSKSPETVAFWEEHVADLNDRIQALDDDDQDNDTATATEQQTVLSPVEQPALLPSNLSHPLNTISTHGSHLLSQSFSMRDELHTVAKTLSIKTATQHTVANTLSIKTATTPASPSLKAATTPTSPSRDRMQWKDEPSFDVPMVDVIAPADLPGGYHFEAELEGKRFLATVPAGGVKQGETFTCYMRELDSVAIDIPVGYWKDSLANVCAYGCCHPVFWNPIICPLTALWQVQTRVGLDFMGRPLEEGSGPPVVPNRTTLLTVLSSWVLINGALLAGYNYKWSRGLNLSFADISAIGLVNLSMILFLVFITQSTRSSLREKFMIREHRCSDLEDLYVSTFALPCTIAQMSRHTANYDDYEAVCCSKTGLPEGVRVNQQQVSSDSDFGPDASKYEAPPIV